MLSVAEEEASRELDAIVGEIEEEVMQKCVTLCVHGTSVCTVVWRAVYCFDHVKI